MVGRVRRTNGDAAAIMRFMPESGLKLLESSGPDFIEELGIDAVKSVVASILCGENLRDHTEQLTRKKLALMNAATLVMFVNGLKSDPNFVRSASAQAVKGLSHGLPKVDRWVLQWLLGLTDKAFQNVLRDKKSGLLKYATGFDEAIVAAAKQSKKEHGDLRVELALNGSKTVSVAWEDFLRVLSTIGAETLAIRGSDKSLYGKLFERLVLGALLSMLGFRQVSPPPNLEDTRDVFWLSSTGKRESDATVLCGAGRGVRFDIGFIGRGNPEISLDKVSRFERHLDFGRGKYYMATFIIVDRIGERSRITDNAKAIDGQIVQMSGSYWIRMVADGLDKAVGYKNRIGTMTDRQLHDHIHQSLAKMDIKPFIKGVKIEADGDEE